MNAHYNQQKPNLESNTKSVEWIERPDGTVGSESLDHDKISGQHFVDIKKASSRFLDLQR